MDLTSFRFGGTSLENFGPPEFPCFCVEEVSQMLGIKNRRRLYERLPEKYTTSVENLVKMFGTKHSKSNIQPNKRLLTESGVYLAVATATKTPDARRFQHWLFSEVMPSFRRNGQTFGPNPTKKEEKFTEFHYDPTEWIECKQKGCKHKAPCIESLQIHEMNAHNIGVKWYKCDYPGCQYETKKNANLKAHLRGPHDVGNHKCDFCLDFRYSSLVFEDIQGKHHICRTCYRTATGHSSRVEKDWSDYIDKTFGKEYLTSSDKSMISQGGCLKYRPDKLYIAPDIVLLLECDEYQHAGTSYSCDERRISELFDEFGGKKMVVIRWNPDKYQGGNETRKDRMKACVKQMRYVLKNPPLEPIHVFYMFYDEDGENIVRHLPKTFL